MDHAKSHAPLLLLIHTVTIIPLTQALEAVQWDTHITCRINININTSLNTSTSIKLDRVRVSHRVQNYLVPIRCIIFINNMASIPDLLAIIGG